MFLEQKFFGQRLAVIKLTSTDINLLVIGETVSDFYNTNLDIINISMFKEHIGSKDWKERKLPKIEFITEGKEKGTINIFLSMEIIRCHLDQSPCDLTLLNSPFELKAVRILYKLDGKIV